MPRRLSWRKSAPHSINPRRSLRARCGSRCFLMPSQLKFPICDSNCKIDRRGVIAAEVRASQYGYRGVRAKARRILYGSRGSPRRGSSRPRSSRRRSSLRR